MSNDFRTTHFSNATGKPVMVIKRNSVITTYRHQGGDADDFFTFPTVTFDRLFTAKEFGS